MGCGQSKSSTTGAKAADPNPRNSGKNQKTPQQKMIDDLQRQLQGDALKEEEVIVPERGFDEGIIDRGVETR